jgi:hypothetical protein
MRKLKVGLLAVVLVAVVVAPKLNRSKRRKPTGQLASFPLFASVSMPGF